MKRSSVVISSFVVLSILLSACSFSMPQISKTKPAPAGTTAPSGENKSPASTATLVPEGASSSVPLDSAGLDAYQAALTSVFDRVNPSVVSIEVASRVGSQIPEFDLPYNFPDLPEFSKPDQEGAEQQLQYGVGSGFVWDQEGHIITNNHVVDGAEMINVTFEDGTSLQGKVIGTDKNSDLAVVKVEKGTVDLKPVEMADSNKLKVGNLVMAIGNPFGLEGSFSVGVISALGRSLPVDGSTVSGSYTIPDVIQTDAPINPGNSGGVLVNTHGQVIGVTTAIESPVRANAGIGFAVPSAIIQKVIPALIQDGKFSYTYLGLSGGTLTSDLAKAMGLKETQRGILVNAINPNTPADKAGLKGSTKETEIQGQTIKVGGDIIVRIDSQELHRFEDLVSYLARATVVGQKVTLDIIRDGKEIQVEATLEARPETEKTAAPEEQDIKGNAWMGVTLAELNTTINKAMELDETTKGVLVTSVEKDGPADKAGLQGGDKPLDVNGNEVMIGGDIITAFNGEAVNNIRDMRNRILRSDPGEEVTLSILRDGSEKEVKLTLAERPAE